MTKGLRKYLSNLRYRERHPDRMRERDRRRYKSNPQTKKSYSKRYRQHHHDTVKQQDSDRKRIWRLANPDKHRERAIAWTKANPDKVRQRHRRWAKAHPESSQQGCHRRRARKLGNGGTFTAAEWQTLKRQYGFRCVGCWKLEADVKTLGRTLVPDHIVPLIKGGLNHITNLQPLCHGTGGCNNSKSNEYIEYVTS